MQQKNNNPQDSTSIPKQYQRGYVDFYKLKFKVTPDVLIPRPESELLVDEVLAYFKDVKSQNCTILDIGTGSGCLAISLAKNLMLKTPTPGVGVTGTGVEIIATDISKSALKVARQNAKLYGVQDTITFIHSNLLSSLKSFLQYSNTRQYHSKDIPTVIIIANLPYIPTQRIPYLDPSVKDFEPIIALDGGPDGFDLYRKLFKQLSGIMLTPPRCQACQAKILEFMVCEIDYTQGELAVLEALKYFPQAKVEARQDLAKKQRILLIR